MDKHYKTRSFVEELRGINITLHAAQTHTNRSSAIDGPTERHGGYAISQQMHVRVD